MLIQFVMPHTELVNHLQSAENSQDKPQWLNDFKEINAKWSQFLKDSATTCNWIPILGPFLNFVSAETTAGMKMSELIGSKEPAEVLKQFAILKAQALFHQTDFALSVATLGESSVNESAIKSALGSIAKENSEKFLLKQLPSFFEKLALKLGPEGTKAATSLGKLFGFLTENPVTLEAMSTWLSSQDSWKDLKGKAKDSDTRHQTAANFMETNLFKSLKSLFNSSGQSA